MPKAKSKRLISNRTEPANDILTVTNATTQQHLQNPQSQPLINLTSVSMTVLEIIISILKIFNSLLMVVAYVLLVFQTVYVLNSKQPKYINLRHLILKWIGCVFFYLIAQGFSSGNDINSQIVTVLLNIIIIGIAYPSRITKAVHLKYFSHKQHQRYSESVNDPIKYDISFVTKIIISIVVTLLNLCKFLITFVLPNYRKQIQESLRGVNNIVIDQKCFWSIYNDKKGELSSRQKDKLAIKQFLTAGTGFNSSRNENMMPLQSSNMYSSLNLSPNSVRQGKEIIKAYGEKCSNITSNGFKPVKRVSIKYYVYQSKLEILDLDFGKLETYILEQLTEKQGNVLEFIVLVPGQKFNQPIYIKFKNYRELQIFMKSIQEFEKVL